MKLLAEDMEGFGLFQEAMEYWCRNEPVPEDIKEKLKALPKEQQARISAQIFDEASE